MLTDWRENRKKPWKQAVGSWEKQKMGDKELLRERGERVCV